MGIEPATAAASGARSAAATSPLIADPGPAFDPKAAGGEPPQELPTAPAGESAAPAAGGVLELGWEEPVVRSLLAAKGELLHSAIAVDKDSDEWVYLPREQQAIAPPLTRILNRYDATRAAAATGDELALMIGLAGYVTRSVKQRRADIAAIAPAEPEPISGVAAPPETGPQPGGEVAGGGIAPPGGFGNGAGGFTDWQPPEGET